MNDIEARNQTLRFGFLFMLVYMGILTSAVYLSAGTLDNPGGIHDRLVLTEAGLTVPAAHWATTKVEKIIDHFRKKVTS